MARIQQSIEVGVPVHAAYQQLTHFEDYPRFMQEVDTVRRLDSTHLHWSANMSYQTLEWDAEITEQLPGRCIAWRNIGGPIEAERIDLQPLGPSKSRVTMTMDCDPLQLIPAQDGNADDAVAERLRDDLERFKSWIEANGAEASAMVRLTRDISEEMRSETMRSEAMRSSRTADNTPPAASGYAAGSEGWAGNEDPSEPMTPASHLASEGPGWGKDTTATPSAPSVASSTVRPAEPQAGKSTQSDYSLSQSQDEQADDARFGVAEEQSFDQQSEQARRIGQAMSDPSAMDVPDTESLETAKRSIKPEERKDRTPPKP
jgi:hypothetical protein